LAPKPSKIPLGTILFLIFVVMPITELALLVWLASVTSFWFTLGVVLATAMLGATMLKFHGRGVWLAATREMAAGRFPADQLLDGILLLIGGTLLVTPGLITDTIGILALLPPSRAVLRGIMRIWIKDAIARGTIRVGGVGMGGGMPFPPPGFQPPQQQPEATVEDKRGWPGAGRSPFDR